MLTKVTAYSQWPAVDPLVLNIKDRPETDLFEVRNIDGLGSVKANVNTTPLGSVKGESFNGSSVGSRNIVFTLGLDPDWETWTISKLRRLLDKYFLPELRTRLVFETTEFSPVEISGIVENNDPNMFSKDPEHQISIICPSPDFIGVDAVIVTGQTDDGPVAIDYQGDIEIGINVGVTRFSDPAPTQITVSTEGLITKNFITEASVDFDTMFEINSVPGNKYVQNVDISTSIATNRLQNVDVGYIWPTLIPGSNTFEVSSDAGVQNWELQYLEHYGSL